MPGRKRRRITIVGDVIIDKIHNTKGLDVSEGGMYVFTTEPFKKGQRVSVSIPFGDTSIEVGAVVQHVEPEMGAGLRFFDLDQKQHALIREYIEHFSTRPLGSTKKRVLLADGNEVSRNFDRNRLCIEGFDVFAVGSGPELLEVLKEEEVDMVITDMFLDRMDVFKLLSLMKQQPEWKHIPVVVLTSTNKPEDIDRAAASGAIEILPRITTSPIKLTEKVKKILGI